MADRLAALQALVRAASGDRWAPTIDDTGVAIVHVEFNDGRSEMLRVTREQIPADARDIVFVGHCRRDVERLIWALRGEEQLTHEELNDTDQRCQEATAAPWRPFLESEGGIGGSSVITVSDRGDEPDIYRSAL